MDGLISDLCEKDQLFVIGSNYALLLYTVVDLNQKSS